MRENSNISEYRNRLDKTLSSPDLTNMETLKILVKDQILNSSNLHSQECIDSITENRTKEVSNFLSMLRSVSVDGEESNLGDSSHRSWKVKQDTEEFRVMYREGPEGTPFHTLLVEGYVDGPADVCLCISCEASLYPKWWPQTTVPAFKITSSQCLKKVRPGEQICLVRMKVSWPLSAREALVHFFEFDYFQDDLVVVLLNTIPDLESIDISTHGFTRDGVPDAQDVVRIDVVGGFAIQKVSENRSYFRTIANMDIKLDFVPPAFINFVSRQLVGSGFKLYKKEVASISKGSADFSEALKDPFYARVREALFSKEVSIVAAPKLEAQMNGKFHPLEEQQQQEVGEEEVINGNISDKSSHGEIEEIGEDAIESSNSPVNHPSAKRVCTGNHSKVFIRPQVEQALRTLDKAISFLKEHKSDDKTNSLPVIAVDEESQDSKTDAAAEEEEEQQQQHQTSGTDKISNTTIMTSNEPRNSSGSHNNSRRGSNTYSRDSNTSKIAPASPDEDVPDLYKTRDRDRDTAAALCSSQVVVEEIILKEHNTKVVVSSQNENKTRRMRTRISREKKYDIEGDNLEGKYKGWQKKLHPDLVHTKSQKEREYAAEQSARVTDSYRTLTNPLSRAKYMMKLEGVEVDEEERITDPELLSEIMEIREAVEEAAETQELHQIQEKIRGKLEYWSTSFGAAFNSRNYDEAVNSIRRMTYYVRAIEEIVKKL